MRQFMAVILMAVVTYIPRVLPITVVKKKLKSRFLRSFLFYVPFAVLGSMTFPSIIYSTSHVFSATLGMIVAILLAYFNQKLLPVALSAIAVVYVCELIV